MPGTHGMVLVREILGIPLDLGLAAVAMVVMLGLIAWGSRPSVIARHGERPPGEPPERRE